MKIASIKTVHNEFQRDLSEFSFDLALRRIVPHIPLLSESGIYTDYRRRTERYLKSEFRQTVRHTVDTFDPADCEAAKKRIWVMWWQGGEDTMPPVVRGCYRQLLSVCGEYEVVLITRDNYDQYVSIPEHILSKVNDGIISLTHLSDIIRCKLLYEHGGLYLDATIYADDVSFLEKYEFFTLRTPGKYPDFPSDGGWTGFAMYFSETHSLFMKCLDECFNYYWENHKEIIDYLLIDYTIKCIFDESKEVRACIESVPTCDGYYSLVERINDRYTEEGFSEIMKECPWQKLSYKKELLPVQNGEMTNYGYITREV